MHPAGGIANKAAQQTIPKAVSMIAKWFPSDISLLVVGVVLVSELNHTRWVGLGYKISTSIALFLRFFLFLVFFRLANTPANISRERTRPRRTVEIGTTLHAKRVVHPTSEKARTGSYGALSLKENISNRC